MDYTTETVNSQFLNQSFLDKIEGGLEKEAGAAMSAFVRQKLREEGFTRKILQPQLITAAELDRGLDDEPQVIVEKEVDSVAANMAFTGRPSIRYFNGQRYPVTFYKISSEKFAKSKFELATYRTDIRSILQENSVKDLQEQEDKNFYDSINTIITDNTNNIDASGTAPSATYNLLNALMRGARKLLGYKLPLGKILMTQEMYAALMEVPATQIGDSRASDIHSGGDIESFFGWEIVTTIKNDILPKNKAVFFTKPQYLGQFYMLQDAVVYLKTEADMVEFETYEAVGAGIGNVNGAVSIDVHATFVQ